MFSAAVTEHFMAAHSLKGEAFGPAQGTHGATYVVTAEFKSPALTSDNIVIDIGTAQDILKATVAPLHFKNLDTLPQFEGCNTTTEFLAHHIHGEIAKQLDGSFEGVLCIRIDESHLAWVTYEAPVGGKP